MKLQISAFAALLVVALSATARAQFVPYPPVAAPVENPMTAEKATLGKILFWDEQLSSTNTMACGTCHIPSAGGSDPRSVDIDSVAPGADGMLGTGDETIGSKGVIAAMLGGQYVDDGVHFPNPQVTGRKTPTMIDAWAQSDIFWDGRATSQFTDPQTGLVEIASGGALESQAVGPLVSNVEMAHSGRTWEHILFKINRVAPLGMSDSSTFPADVTAALGLYPTYTDLFNWAFGAPAPGEDVISAKRVAFAIATYERTLVANQTPWDAHVASVAAMTPSPLTPQQQAGMMVFFGTTCAQCHSGPLFNGGTAQGIFHAVGVFDPLVDGGRFDTTGNPADRGKFKVPTLRNVGLREAGGLFHHGTSNASSIESVINFYNTGPSFTLNTDPMLMPTSGLNLTAQQAADMAEFLRNALTDPRVLAETGPFARPALRSEIDALQNPATASIYFIPRPPAPAGVDQFTWEAIYPLETVDSDGNAPQMIAREPAAVGHPYFTLGVAGTKPNTVAYLLAGEMNPNVFAGMPGTPFPFYPGFFQSLPVWVNVNGPYAQAGVLTQGAGAGNGYASLNVGIATNPALAGFEVWAQWFVADAMVPVGFAASRGIKIKILP
ncbi:MAG: cytochrome c peroxidase [Planctomycetota bacterium]